MIVPPNAQAQLTDPQTGRATNFFFKFLGAVANAFGVTGSVPWAPGPITAGATVSVDVPITSAADGQMAVSTYAPSTAGVVPLAMAHPGNVKAVLWNTTGATVTPTPGTVTVIAWTP